MSKQLNGLGRALALVVCAGTTSVAVAQPVIDGVLDTGGVYGDVKWVQTQRIVSPSKDNFAGAGASLPVDTVATGLELMIPLAAIGAPGGFTAGNPLRMTLMITGCGDGSCMSNQVLGALGGNQANFADSRAVDLDAAPGGDPVSFNPSSLPAGNETGRNTFFSRIDGLRAGTWSGGTSSQYGAIRSAQSNFTGYGDATHGNCSFGAGSEINGVYGYVVNVTYTGTVEPIFPTGRYLFLFVAGNLEVNGNGLQIFFDTVAGAGQNQLRFGNLQGDLVGMSATDSTNANGLKFAAGFAPDYWIGVNASNGDEVGGIQPTLYVDYASLPDDPAVTTPNAAFVGERLMCPTPAPAAADDGVLINGVTTTGTPDASVFLIRANLNNSNIAGVTGTPAGGGAPNIDFAFGSELNNLYSTVADNKLYMFIGGNLESNFTKLTLWFDAADAPSPFDPQPGQNRVRGDNVDISFNGLNRHGDDGTGNGLTFDADFAANYWMGVNIGNAPAQMYIDASTLRNEGRRFLGFGGALDYGAYSGATRDQSLPPNLTQFPSFPTPSDSPPRLDVQDGTAASLYTNYAPRHVGDYLFNLPPSTWDFIPLVPGITPVATAGKIRATLDNRNVEGITTVSTAGAAAVTTGIELVIDLDELGWDGTSCIKVAGLLSPNNQYASYSNQILGELPPNSGNLGDPRLINFSDETLFPGNQYITLWCPTPVTCNADYNRDGFLNLDDLGDFITDFYVDIAIPGGLQPNAPTYSDNATIGYGVPCEFAGDASPPYAVDAYRTNGFRVGYSFDGSNSCPLDPSQVFPNLDNLGDFITFYYESFNGIPGNGCQ
jgi:hypothetical protein